MIDTKLLSATDQGIDEAAALLCAGEIVAFGTETVYGLGADATQGDAVAKIYAAKDRPTFNPLIVHVCDVAMAKRFVHWTAEAELLAQAFWPGPLTLVLPLRRESRIATLASAGLNTLGVRLPATAIAQDVIKRLGQPVAAPSANPSGQLSPVLASHVMEGLGGRIAAVLNSGPCTVGLESTIVGLAQEPRLLRPGGVTREKLEALLGSSLPMHDPSAAINAPGQLASHYAPSATLRLNATEATDGEMLIGFGDVPGEVSLSQSGDLSEAARNLFDVLHEADRIDRPLAVAPIPDSGLGVAINDRLARAAAPRD